MKRLSPRIVLIGNYEPDRQESMQRFANLLYEQFVEQGLEVELLRPQVIFGRFRFFGKTLTKWLGYLDKFVVFPLRLGRLSASRNASGPEVIVHICDHSNAPYVKQLRGVRCLVTCHDLLAVRSARGEFPENPTGMSGRILQRVILDGLSRSSYVACVSAATRSDFLRLVGLPSERVSIVANGLNYPYRPMPDAEAVRLIREAWPRTGRLVTGGDLGIGRCILHVGGNQWYKNRHGVLHIYRRLLELMPDAPPLVIAGKGLTSQHRRWISAHGLEERVIVLVNPPNELLRALYSRAQVLLFPSLAEGFGWPIIEAQACGCSVVTAAQPPLQEVGGDAALYCNPRNFIEAASLLRDVLGASAGRRQEIVELNRGNVARFSTRSMVAGYLDLYQQILAE